MPCWLCYTNDAAFQACDLLGLDRSVVQDFKQVMESFSKRLLHLPASRHWDVCLGQTHLERCRTILQTAWYVIPSYPTLELKLRMELTDLSLRCTAGTSKEPFWNHCQRISIKLARKLKVTQVARKLMHHKVNDMLPVIILGVPQDYTGIQAPIKHFVSHLDKFLFVVNR